MMSRAEAARFARAGADVHAQLDALFAGPPLVEGERASMRWRVLARPAPRIEPALPAYAEPAPHAPVEQAGRRPSASVQQRCARGIRPMAKVGGAR